MIERIVQDQRRQAVRVSVRAKRAAAVRPPGQRKVPRQRIGVKNIEGRIRNRTFKINRLLVQPKYVDVNIVIRNGKIVWKHGPHVAEF